MERKSSHSTGFLKFLLKICLNIWILEYCFGLSQNFWFCWVMSNTSSSFLPDFTIQTGYFLLYFPCLCKLAFLTVWRRILEGLRKMLIPLKYCMEWTGFLLGNKEVSYHVFASYACFSRLLLRSGVVKLIIKCVDWM